jgi:hypothetical protein
MDVLILAIHLGEWESYSQPSILIRVQEEEEELERKLSS